MCLCVCTLEIANQIKLHSFFPHYFQYSSYSSSWSVASPNNISVAWKSWRSVWQIFGSPKWHLICFAVWRPPMSHWIEDIIKNNDYSHKYWIISDVKSFGLNVINTPVHCFSKFSLFWGSLGILVNVQKHFHALNI